MDPKSPDALYYLGITAGVLAQVEYERLFALAPGSPRAHQLLGESYEAQSRTAEAEAEYEAALAGSPDVGGAAGGARRSHAAERGLRPAIAYFERAAALAPRSYDVLYGLGVSHGRKQEHARAIEYLREAVRLDPSSASAHLALGSSLLQTGQAQAAVAEFEAAAAQEPQMRQAYYLLGRAYKTLGRSQASEAAFARFQELAEEGRRCGSERDRHRRARPRRSPSRAEAAALAGASMRNRRAAGWTAFGVGGHRLSLGRGASPPPTAASEPVAAAGGVSFTDVTRAAGLASFRHTSGSAAKDYILEATGSGVALVDYDNDGWLDAYLVNGSTFAALRGQEEAPSAALFRNNRDGTFTDVTAAAGVANRRWGQGACVG